MSRPPSQAADLANTLKFLESLRRHDLSKLLAHASIEIDEGEWFDIRVIVHSPRPFAEALAALPPDDRKRIAEAALSDQSQLSAPGNITVVPTNGQSVSGLPSLLPELIIHQQMLIDVGTGSSRIQDVNDYYIARQARLTELCAAAGIKYENPHDDLWDWFNRYKNQFGSYAERRKYVRDMFRPLIAAAAGRSFVAGAEREPTGWERVDRTLSRARTLLGTASAEEDFQSIGLLCREVMISLAQAVYDPKLHVSEDGATISPTDANRMLEAYIGHVFPGESYKEVRAHARAALALALNLQHRRTATRQLASLCLEAATSATAVISIISGKTG